MAHFDEISKILKNRTFIGGVKKLPFDHETVISLASKFQDESHFFLLESASTGPGQVARYSFMGYDPEILLNSATQTSANPFDLLSDSLAGKSADLYLIDEQSVVDLSELKNISGFVGYFSYDSARFVEPSIGVAPTRELGLPDAFFMFTKNLIVYDHFFRSLYLIHFVPTNDQTPEGCHRQIVNGIAAIEAKINNSKVLHQIKIKSDELDFNAAKSHVDKETFLRRVDTCLEHIRAGDVFQIQIGNRLSVETQANPFDIFRHLRIINPSPYMFYYKFEDHHIIGASPEMMVNVEGKKVVHRPIAGTRKRSWNSEKDLKICEELQSDEKERAEHIMLVDLGRNDIGRLAVSGSVNVDELMIVEKYSHVFHMVSQVSGVLSDEFDAVAALKLSFPNGTVSGAPKIKAMKIIYELEDISREFYAGSLGLFSFSGDLKSTIMIRTIHYRNGIASTQASAGIVYDSVPEMEWMETRNKMAACLTAMQNTL